jgi:hypothetical protein
MKRTGQVLLGLLIVSVASVAATPDKGLMTLFQDAMYQEQTAGDLDKAIELYQKVVTDSGEIEKLAAKATFQLGMCYLKKDDKTKAAEYFKKVVSIYPAQKELVAQAQKQLEQIAPQSSGDGGFLSRLPQSVLNRLGALYGQLCAESGGMQIASNCHIHYVDAEFNHYWGGYRYFMNRSASPTSGKIDLGNTSYLNQILYDIGGKVMNVELVKDEARPNFYRIFWTPEIPIGPWQVFPYASCINDASKLTSDGSTYSLKMQNHFGGRVLEAFYLVLPDKVNLTSPSENYTSKESLDGYIIYSWKKNVPQDAEHLVRVTLVSLRDATPEELAKIIKDAVATISTCAETDPKIKDATDSLAGLDSGLVVTEVCKYFDSDTDAIRRAAIYTLWKGGLPDITAAEAKLISLCSHKENFTRGMAALTLSSIKTAASFDAIEKMALEDSDYARRCAVYALGLYGDSAAIPIVEKALKDNDPMVKANAQTAMTLLKKNDAAGSDPNAPVIVKTSPEFGKTDVSPDLDKISVTFDQPMRDGSWAWCQYGENYPEVTGMPSFDKNFLTCSMPIRLQPGQVYLVGLNTPPYEGFHSRSGITARPGVMVFATKDPNGNPTPIPEQMMKKANTSKVLQEGGGNIKDILSDTDISVFDAVGPAAINLHKSAIAYAKEKNVSHINTHVHYVTSRMIDCRAGIGTITNGPDAKNAGVEISVANYDDNKLIFVDEEGKILKTRFRDRNTNIGRYGMYLTLDKPLAANETRLFVWINQNNSKLTTGSDGNCELKMKNNFGSQVVETFILVLPKGIKLVEQSEEPTTVTPAGDYQIYHWQAIVPQKTNHEVTVKLASENGGIK